MRFGEGRNALRDIDRVYRRGLVLGLNVAEIFLLLLFLLLLAVAAASMLREAEKRELEKQNSDLRGRLEDAQKEIDGLAAIKKELERGGISSDRIETLIAATRERAQLQRDNKKLRDELDELRPLAEVGEAIKKAVSEAGTDISELLDNPNALEEILRDAHELAKARAEIEELKKELTEHVKVIGVLSWSAPIDWSSLNVSA